MLRAAGRGAGVIVTAGDSCVGRGGGVRVGVRLVGIRGPVGVGAWTPIDGGSFVRSLRTNLPSDTSAIFLLARTSVGGLCALRGRLCGMRCGCAVLSVDALVKKNGRAAAQMARPRRRARRHRFLAHLLRLVGEHAHVALADRRALGRGRSVLRHAGTRRSCPDERTAAVLAQLCIEAGHQFFDERLTEAGRFIRQHRCARSWLCSQVHESSINHS